MASADHEGRCRVLSLTNQGSGLYSGTMIVTMPGSYEFKFRKAGDWGVSIGSDFGNLAGNISFGTTVDNQTVRFDLDLPHGRYKVTLVGAAIRWMPDSRRATACPSMWTQGHATWTGTNCRPAGLRPTPTAAMWP